MVTDLKNLFEVWFTILSDFISELGDSVQKSFFIWISFLFACLIIDAHSVERMNQYIVCLDQQWNFNTFRFKISVDLFNHFINLNNNLWCVNIITKSSMDSRLGLLYGVIKLNILGSWFLWGWDTLVSNGSF